MDFRIRLAGRIISIHSLCPQTAVFFRQYLAKGSMDADADFSITTTTADLLAELDFMKPTVDENNTIPFRSEFELETLSIQRKIAETMPAFNTFLMHGSVVETNGLAYMITAPSGTGKSTRTKLWLEEMPDSIVINGDKPLLRVEEDLVYACGTPWNGKERWGTNTEAPLRAIFLLERAAEGQKSTIAELTFSQAFNALLQQTYQPVQPESLMKIMHLLKAMDGKVKFYQFRSDLSREAVLSAYETAKP